MQITDYYLSEEEIQAVDTKLTELLELCQILHLPMFATCAIGNNETETLYLSRVYNAKSHDIHLKDDHIRKHMLIANKNFDVIPKREILMEE